mmetsp:Transcript_56035/g.141867  ORF Transcript_56035/g.141867 Transcript_56035/m.141867 type:complete len:298 (-) Transcript_56035:331-1224(-)
MACLAVVPEDGHAQHGTNSNSGAAEVIMNLRNVILIALRGTDIRNVQEMSRRCHATQDALCETYPDLKLLRAMVRSRPGVQLLLLLVNEGYDCRLNVQHILHCNDDMVIHVLKRPLPLLGLLVLPIYEQQRKHANQTSDRDAQQLSCTLPPLRGWQCLLRPGQRWCLKSCLGGHVLDDAARENAETVRHSVAQRSRCHRGEAKGRAQGEVDHVPEDNHHCVVEHAEPHERQCGGHAHLFQLCCRWRVDLSLLPLRADPLHVPQHRSVEAQAASEVGSQSRIVLDEPGDAQHQLGVLL